MRKSYTFREPKYPVGHLFDGGTKVISVALRVIDEEKYVKQWQYEIECHCGDVAAKREDSLQTTMRRGGIIQCPTCAHRAAALSRYTDGTFKSVRAGIYIASGSASDIDPDDPRLIPDPFIRMKWPQEATA